MKVLHVITGNDNGGGANHVLSICTKKNSCFENVLACIGQGPLYEKAKDSQIDYKLFEDKICNGEIIKYINENSIDIVNFHGAKAFLTHLVLKNKIKIPAVATLHSDYRYDFLNNKIKYYLFTPLSTLGLRSFNNYICVSENLKVLLEQKGFKGKKAVVNNGINIDDVEFKSTREELRKKLNIKQDEFVFCMIGRMHPIKNHKNIIEAFNKMCSEFSNVKLVLAGDGDVRSSIEQQVNELNIKDKVIFTGVVSNTVDYFKASEIGVLASFSEGGAPPLVVLEGSMAKRTFITTKVGDLEKIINESNGYIIKSQEIESIYDAMKRAFLEKDKIDVMGENLYNLVCNNFSMEKFWKGYYNFYKSITGDDLTAF